MQKISMNVIPRTIYGDIVGLPDPILLGITIHYYNHSDETLYMKIFGSGPSPWNSNAVELGSLASGANAYINLDNFLSRTKPTEALTEELTLTLKGYMDSGYSDLKYEFSRTCTAVFIKSDDGTWTTDHSNNFDDETVEGWAVALIDTTDTDPTISCDIATDYVLSVPYSLKMTIKGVDWFGGGLVKCWSRGKFYKNFTTPNKDVVYAIANLRISGYVSGSIYGKQLKVLRDSTTLIYLGKEPDHVSSEYFPKNKWVRLVFPLPKNTDLTVNLVIACLGEWVANGERLYIYGWLDDFKIISK